MKERQVVKPRTKEQLVQMKMMGSLSSSITCTYRTFDETCFVFPSFFFFSLCLLILNILSSLSSFFQNLLLQLFHLLLSSSLLFLLPSYFFFLLSSYFLNSVSTFSSFILSHFCTLQLAIGWKRITLELSQNTN